jgi:hypothetical protein
MEGGNMGGYLRPMADNGTSPFPNNIKEHINANCTTTLDSVDLRKVLTILGDVDRLQEITSNLEFDFPMVSPTDLFSMLNTYLYIPFYR